MAQQYKKMINDKDLLIDGSKLSKKNFFRTISVNFTLES